MHHNLDRLGSVASADLVNEFSLATHSVEVFDDALMSPQKTSSEPVGLLTCSINNQRLAYASDVSPLSVNDFERCDRQLHHGSTTTTWLVLLIISVIEE
uniref:Uncharacterized protein n=1 Tax=Ascaris lumbricoides TaxID=6252 RepID=A0A0M3I2L0_ASCLU